MSPIPPEVAALVEERQRLADDLGAITIPREIALFMQTTHRLIDACLALLASPPAPVEDDGLDALIAEYDGGPTTACYTSGDLRRWLRELQARRRGDM